MDHQRFGGAQNEGEPNEPMVEGSDYTRISTLLREDREDRAGQPTAEEGKLRDSSMREHIRVVRFNLQSHLVSNFWPEEYLIRTTLEPRSESDWQLYPHFGKYSPWFPGFLQNDVSWLEFEGNDRVRAGVVLTWCNSNERRLRTLLTREAVGTLAASLRGML